MQLINKPLKGGCQCGAIRYEAPYHLDNAHICHCRMCQKALGNVFAALVGCPITDLKWLKAIPDTYASSAIVERGFCARCGTPLYYHELGSGRISVTIGSLDNPSEFAPKQQIGTESKVTWCDALPALTDGGTTESTISAETAERIRSTNRQHPDG